VRAGGGKPGGPPVNWLRESLAGVGVQASFVAGNGGILRPVSRRNDAPRRPERARDHDSDRSRPRSTSISLTGTRFARTSAHARAAACLGRPVLKRPTGARRWADALARRRARPPAQACRAPGSPSARAARARAESERAARAPAGHARPTVHPAPRRACDHRARCEVDAGSTRTRKCC
jgi:hypothetical protein